MATQPAAARHHVLRKRAMCDLATRMWRLFTVSSPLSLAVGGWRLLYCLYPSAKIAPRGRGCLTTTF
jgi:hypothetical protein